MIVKLISWNLNNDALCASAARISTTKGTAIEIFDKATDSEKNKNLIAKVLSSGHTSIIEHAVFTFALENVSAFTEEFFIECRLASFTVKSRRYVDFSGLGYYTPQDLESSDLQIYHAYMDKLFAAYNEMLENGVPKEDARFLLPYSFNSNFYCTMNARELIRIISEIRYGRMAAIPELCDLADQILQQTASVFPIVNLVVENMRDSWHLNNARDFSYPAMGELEILTESEIGKVEMLQAPTKPKEILQIASQCYHPQKLNVVAVDEILQTNRNRELEQLTYTFHIRNITLSGITHIVRHRMQSLIIPPLTEINYNKIIVPNTIAKNPELLHRYQVVLADIADMRKTIRTRPTLLKYQYYFALSGNLADILSTVNGRELIHMIRLRSCNRAQWEIKNIVVAMLKLARSNYPELFQKVGPNCFMYGKCPETRLACGKQSQTIKEFSDLK
ncbi:MAG: FAD-dependent thymidylate synthase [Ruminococcaceae bacterium]|nr:FAD-dependent thymidylate synthase [Oscillospiraceae bacterium]